MAPTSTMPNHYGVGAPRRSPSRTNFWLDLTTAIVLAALTGTGVPQR